MMVKLQFQKVSNLKLDNLKTSVLCYAAQLAIREIGDDMFTELRIEKQNYNKNDSPCGICEVTHI